MSTIVDQPALLIALAAGVLGAALLVHARLQARLLRQRIASGTSTVVVDPATGLYCAAAAWQCIRAEANRALRLERSLDVWIGAASDAAELDRHGRELVFSMPAGAMGVRIDPRHVCVISCAGDAAAPNDVVDSLQWRTMRVEPGEHAATDALAFVSEVTHAA